MHNIYIVHYCLFNIKNISKTLAQFHDILLHHWSKAYLESC